MRPVEMAWRKVLRQATTDPAFRKALKANPSKVLAEAGIRVDKATEYVVVEQSPKKFHIILPPMMDVTELSEEMLDRVAGGMGMGIAAPMGDEDDPWQPGGGGQ